jgi:hypothetical protein
VHDVFHVHENLDDYDVCDSVTRVSKLQYTDVRETLYTYTLIRYVPLLESAEIGRFRAEVVARCSLQCFFIGSGSGISKKILNCTKVDAFEEFFGGKGIPPS